MLNSEFGNTFHKATQILKSRPIEYNVVNFSPSHFWIFLLSFLYLYFYHSYGEVTIDITITHLHITWVEYHVQVCATPYILSVTARKIVRVAPSLK